MTKTRKLSKLAKDEQIDEPIQEKIWIISVKLQAIGELIKGYAAEPPLNG